MTQSRKYLTVLLGCAITLCLGVFGINLFFDPLWYRNGNQLDGVNYMFNERFSKTNQYLRRAASHNYNCIIFGSSRTTLFNESLLDSRYRCYNFSFSGGRIEEFIAWAKWLKNKGENPKYVILGIDDFNFVELDSELNIPDFIKYHTKPPNIFYSYFSLDAFDMSFRLLTHDRYNPKIYDRDFFGTVIQDPPHYRPRLLTFEHTLHKPVVDEYRQIRKIFPQSILIGYIPPISSWITASKSQEELNFFLHSVYTMSSFFHVFYDFSIPSEVTNNQKNTYDGSHYFPFIQSKMVQSINIGQMAFGIDVKKFSRETYIQSYSTAVEKFQSFLQDYQKSKPEI